MNEITLEVKGLTKRYGNRTIVDQLSFAVKKGEIFGLLGPNGAGKTTTIRMIVGLISKQSGTVHIDGHDIDQSFIQAMTKIGAIVENPEMFDYFTGYQNLVHFARMARQRITMERIDEVVQLVDLQNVIGRKVKTYSLGMKQRLGLAQAMLHRPAVLILDEPTNGLDPQGIYAFREYLRRLAHEGTSVVVSSHLLSEMQLMCDRVAIIQNGKLVSINTVHELTADQAQAQWIAFEVDDLDQAKVILSDSHADLEITPNLEIELLLEREYIPTVVRTLMDGGVSVYGINWRKRTLEEQFLEMTKAGEIE